MNDRKSGRKPRLSMLISWPCCSKANADQTADVPCCWMEAGAEAPGGARPVLSIARVASAARGVSGARRLSMHDGRLPDAGSWAWRRADRRPHQAAPGGRPGRALEPAHLVLLLRRQAPRPPSPSPAGVGGLSFREPRGRNRPGVNSAFPRNWKTFFAPGRAAEGWRGGTHADACKGLATMHPSAARHKKARSAVAPGLAGFRRSPYR